MTEQLDPTLAFVGFARLPRARGLRLTPTEIGHFQAAVRALPTGDLEHLYWAGRVCLAVLPARVADYNEVFAQYFLGVESTAADDEEITGAPAPVEGPDQARDGSVEMRVSDPAADPDSDETAPEEDAGAAAARIEVLRFTPFAKCSEEELAIVTALVRRMRTPPRERPDRRKAPGYRKEAVDLRTTARRLMKTQADLLLPAWRQRQRRPRRVVMLLDVSRSMEVYSRLLLHFAYAARVGQTRCRSALLRHQAYPCHRTASSTSAGTGVGGCRDILSRTGTEAPGIADAVSGLRRCVASRAPCEAPSS